MMRGRMKWFLYGMGSAGLLMLALGGTAAAVVFSRPPCRVGLDAALDDDGDDMPRA